MSWDVDQQELVGELPPISAKPFRWISLFHMWIERKLKYRYKQDTTVVKPFKTNATEKKKRRSWSLIPGSAAGAAALKYIYICMYVCIIYIYNVYRWFFPVASLGFTRWCYFYALKNWRATLGCRGLCPCIGSASSPSEVTVAVRIFQISQRVTWRAATKIYDDRWPQFGIIGLSS